MTLFVVIVIALSSLTLCLLLVFFIIELRTPEITSAGEKSSPGISLICVTSRRLVPGRRVPTSARLFYDCVGLNWQKEMLSFVGYLLIVLWAFEDTQAESVDAFGSVVKMCYSNVYDDHVTYCYIHTTSY
jgi:hypothetical protein